LVEDFAKRTGVDHAGFDIAMVGRHPYLLEFNRIFGTAGVNSLVGDLSPAIMEWLRSKMDDHKPIEPITPRPTVSGRRARVRRVA